MVINPKSKNSANVSEILGFMKRNIIDRNMAVIRYGCLLATIACASTQTSTTQAFDLDNFLGGMYSNTTDAGWVATISCTPSLGISNNDFIDFSYYPNPTNGNLNIKSNTSISEITVFNIEGRRLFNQTLDTLETSVDISQFATGTYFFKLKFGEKEANFKVLKM